MRKPIEVELVGGKSPRQRVWDEVRKQPDWFGSTQVCPGDFPLSSATLYLTCLAKAGFLEVNSSGRYKRYRLVRNVGIEAPKVRKNGEIIDHGSINEAMWGAMQALQSFTSPVLASMAGAQKSTSQTYCVLLARAGYLKVERPASRGKPVVYRLLNSRVHGPRPPMIKQLHVVYDPNINQIVWQQPAQDVMEDGHELSE